MLSERIKEIRKYFKLSQTAFGERIGVSIDVIKNIEYNRVVPNELLVSHLCAIYGINKHWLETGEGEMLDGKTEDEILVEQAIRKAGDSPAIRALLEAWLKLPDNGRIALEKFAADFVANWQAQQDARKEAETAARVRENIHSEESAASNQ